MFENNYFCYLGEYSKQVCNFKIISVCYKWKLCICIYCYNGLKENVVIKNLHEKKKLNYA